MKTIILRLIIFIITLCPISAFCKDLQNSMWPIVQSGVYLREASSQKSKIICLVPFGNSVLLLNEKKEDKVNKIRGYWQKAKFNNSTGWIFDGYLDKMNLFDENGNKVYKKYGNYIISGLGHCKEGLFGGWSYNLLLYKNKPVGFIHNFALIKDDIALILDSSLSGITSDSDEILTVSIGSYCIIENGKATSLNNILPLYNYFSSPNIIDKQIFYWGIDDKNVYAICYDYFTKNKMMVLYLNFLKMNLQLTIWAILIDQ